MDVDARLQLFDLKTKYEFVTSPGVDQYNMPLYDVQTEPGGQSIGSYPVYQGFLSPAYINGIQVPLQTEKNSFFNIWPNVVQNLQATTIGNGTAGPYTITMPVQPNSTNPLNPPINALLRGHVDITGIMALANNEDPPIVTSLEAIGIGGNPGTIQQVPVTSVNSYIYITSIGSDGSNVVVADSGQFLEGFTNYGLLMTPGKAPFGNLPLPGIGGYSSTSNTINYLTGVAKVEFPVAIPAGANINAQCYYFQTGLPRTILFYNNVLTLRSCPDRQYIVSLEAYLSPAAFLNTNAAIPFGYMAEYIARGAARKMLSDTGDTEQFIFYEPLFKEQELLVWKRSQRQWTSTRTQTIYSEGINQGQSGFNNIGGSTI